MKIRFTLPWGGTFEFERQPREPLNGDKFAGVCILIGLAMLFGCVLAAILT